MCVPFMCVCVLRESNRLVSMRRTTGQQNSIPTNIHTHTHTHTHQSYLLPHPRSCNHVHIHTLWYAHRHTNPRLKHNLCTVFLFACNACNPLLKEYFQSFQPNHCLSKQQSKWWEKKTIAIKPFNTNILLASRRYYQSQICTIPRTNHGTTLPILNKSHTTDGHFPMTRIH